MKFLCCAQRYIPVELKLKHELIKDLEKKEQVSVYMNTEWGKHKHKTNGRNHEYW